MKVSIKSGNKIYSAATSLLLLVIMLCLETVEAEAQEQMQISFKVKLINKANGDKEFTEPVLYKLCANKREAEKLKVEFEKIFNSSDPLRMYDNWAKFKKSNNISRKTPGNGRVSGLNILSGMAILLMVEEDGVATMFEVKEGVTDYTVEPIKVQRTGEVRKTGKRQLKPRTIIIETDNGEEQFRIQIPIDKDLIKESSRLILQTYAVDCMTDDTVDYCKPIIYDESEYHGLQDKRMNFDFHKNDKLASGYADGGIPEMIDTTIIYIKKDSKRDYKGPSRYVIEDYHHVYHENMIGGSCLRIRPFKFLDFSVAIPEMELTEEYYDMAEDQVENVQSDLKLKFIQGKDELAQDSLNEIERIKITEELKSYGKELVAPSIVGTASPEGGEKINRDLADKRAHKARAFISQYLPSRTSLSVKTHIYTWEDVAAELDRRRRPDEANTVRAVIAANGKNKPALDRSIRELPFYEASVLPIMEDMRVMKCTYSYVSQHVLTQDEVVNVYLRDKHDFLSGKKPPLSSGDFYNLYTGLANDTIEQDTITMMAYNWLKKMPEADLYTKKIAPYVYYRMARLLQRHGTPDTLLLAPFIDDSVGINVPVNKDGVIVKMNRADIYVAQALNYYQMQKFAKAQEYINWLKEYGASPAGLDKLEMFMNLKNYFGKDEENENFIKAKNFVLNSSTENKAILYTEIPDWRLSFEEADDLVTCMDDSNPKKWYLKGILWASKSETQPDMSAFMQDETEEGFRKLSYEEEDRLRDSDYAAYVKYTKDLEEYGKTHANAPVEQTDEKESVNTDGIKHYLAYFHHSFLLEPTYKRYYYSEGHVDDEMRKKQKYLKKDFAAYEEVFKWLKRRDDARRKELMPNEDENIGETDGSETNADNNKNAGSNGNTDGQAGMTSAETTPAETETFGTETDNAAPK